MTDDLTVLRLDVDSEAMRTLLEAIPGVEPADLEPLAETDDGDDEAGESPPSTERTGPRVGETPPPGAGDPTTEAEGSDAGGRNRRRIALVGAISVTALAVVGAVLYRRRGRDRGIDFDFDDRDGLPVGDGGGTDGGSETETATSERLSSKIDVAPILGMALLAVAAVVVRRLQAGG
ncbi:hypothetical protein BRC91_09230 [Halobacteriales archaeon QS_4_62_28]|nr:MAG: hypothetical protein BRC91_09230 [Halobacteriales archaeon QS_4_62_28]